MRPTRRTVRFGSRPDSNGKIRLVLITGQLGLGGAEQQLYHLLSHIDRSCFCVSVITLGELNEYWEQPISELGIPLWHVSRGVSRVTRATQVVHLLRLLRPDIVHSWSFHANPYAAIGGRLARVEVRLGSVRGAVDKPILRWIGERGLDAVITNSPALAPPRLRRTHLRVVPNGVLIPALTADAERRRLRTQLGVCEDRFVIGTVGRMDANKNHEMLLNGFAQLTRQHSHIQLVIVGDGILRNRVRWVAEQLGIADRVFLPGAVSSSARYLPAFDVFCLTSHSEGMPNALMEAAAAGLPIVSTDWTGCQTLVEDGVTGLLVPRNDSETLSATLNLLLAKQPLRISLGRAAKERMRKLFSVEVMVSRMVKIYEEAVRAR